MLKKRKSDLAEEFFGLEPAARVHFTNTLTSEKYGFKITAASHLGYSYQTVSCGKIWLEGTEDRRRLCSLIAEIISEYRGHDRSVAILTVGLGSESVTADSLGSLAADRIAVTSGEGEKLGVSKMCVIKPGVPARTGLDTAKTVRSIAEQTEAGLIITVDSLSAISPDRLCTALQISDCGVIPGSALSHSSGEISSRTMPCPVISIGVPTVIRADLLSGNERDRGLLVSPSDIDVAVSCYASIIAGGINLAHLGNNLG